MRRLVFSSRWSKVKQAMEDIDWQFLAPSDKLRPKYGAAV